LSEKCCVKVSSIKNREEEAIRFITKKFPIHSEPKRLVIPYLYQKKGIYFIQ